MGSSGEPWAGYALRPGPRSAPRSASRLGPPRFWTALHTMPPSCENKKWLRAHARGIRVAIARGFLRNLETGRGRPARFVLGDPVPNDDSFLPTTRHGNRPSSHSSRASASTTPRSPRSSRWSARTVDRWASSADGSTASCATWHSATRTRRSMMRRTSSGRQPSDSSARQLPTESGQACRQAGWSLGSGRSVRRSSPRIFRPNGPTSSTRSTSASSWPGRRS